MIDRPPTAPGRGAGGDPGAPHLGWLTAAVAPVLQGLLTGDELEQVRLVRAPGADATVLLVVTARGEEFSSYLWSAGQVAESVEEVRRRVASDLQDAISESASGWGEQRPWPPGGS